MSSEPPADHRAWTRRCLHHQLGHHEDDPRPRRGHSSDSSAWRRESLMSGGAAELTIADRMRLLIISLKSRSRSRRSQRSHRFGMQDREYQLNGFQRRAGCVASSEAKPSFSRLCIRYIARLVRVLLPLSERGSGRVLRTPVLLDRRLPCK